MAGAAAVLFNGCETTSAAQKPEITPSSASIRSGEEIAFVASGGFEYTWSLKDETIGRLDTRRGSRVVYKSLYEPAFSNNAIQILTVSSTISGSSGTTNSEAYVQTAEAYITHRPAD